MLIELPILDADTVKQFRAALSDANWCDGRITAGHQSSLAKANSQLAENDPLAIALGGRLRQALKQSNAFFASVLPRRIFPPLFNSYQGGQSFGMHVDNAVRYDRSGETVVPVRTDVSCTLFLSDPDSYDGGELIIEDTYGSHAIKLAAGHLVIYPGSSLHRVAPVTGGQRLASFFWVQSLIRDDTQRRILVELDVAIQQLTASVPEHASLIQLTGVYHNLLRQWSET